MVRKVQATTAPSQQKHIHSEKISFRKKCEKIAKIAFSAFFILSIGIFQAPSTVAGFMIGVALTPLCRDMLLRVQRIWKKHPWEVIGAATLCSLVAFPIVFIATAIGTGAYLGVKFADRSRPWVTEVKNV